MIQFSDSIKSRVLEHRFKHKHITPLMVDKVNTANLIQLLIWWDKSKVAYRHGQFILVEDSHCVLYPDGKLHNHYTGETYNPINVLMTYFGLDFPQAFYVANHFVYKVNKAEIQAYIDKRCIAPSVVVDNNCVDFGAVLLNDLLHSTIPDIKSVGLRRAYAYLHNNRRIDRDIVSNFIKRRLIVMDGKHNLCFLTYRDDEVIAVTKKGTDPLNPFKQNLVKELHTGFFYAPLSAGTEYKEIYVFESCIDLMSYLTLVKMGKLEKPSAESCYISLNGAGTVYLSRILAANDTIQQVYMCLDNDSVGDHATKRYKEYNLHYKITDGRKPLFQYGNEHIHVKDWNEMLCDIAARFSS